MRRQYAPSNLEPVGINVDPVAVNDVHVGVFVEEAGNIGQRAGQENIITVQVGHDVSLHSPEAAIDGITLPGIRLASPLQGGTVRFQHVDRCFVRTAILHQIGNIRIVLLEHAFVDRGLR